MIVKDHCIIYVSHNLPFLHAFLSRLKLLTLLKGTSKVTSSKGRTLTSAKMKVMQFSLVVMMTSRLTAQR